MDFEKVKEIIVETLSCDADKVTMEATLAEDLEADSLSAVDAVDGSGGGFRLAIADEDLPNMKTVGDIYNYLQEHAGEAEKLSKPFPARDFVHCFWTERSLL